MSVRSNEPLTNMKSIGCALNLSINTTTTDGPFDTPTPSKSPTKSVDKAQLLRYINSNPPELSADQQYNAVVEALETGYDLLPCPQHTDAGYVIVAVSITKLLEGMGFFDPAFTKDFYSSARDYVIYYNTLPTEEAPEEPPLSRKRPLPTGVNAFDRPDFGQRSRQAFEDKDLKELLLDWGGQMIDYNGVVQRARAGEIPWDGINTWRPDIFSCITQVVRWVPDLMGGEFRRTMLNNLDARFQMMDGVIPTTGAARARAIATIKEGVFWWADLRLYFTPRALANAVLWMAPPRGVRDQLFDHISAISVARFAQLGWTGVIANHLLLVATRMVMHVLNYRMDSIAKMIELNDETEADTWEAELVEKRARKIARIDAVVSQQEQGLNARERAQRQLLRRGQPQPYPMADIRLPVRKWKACVKQAKAVMKQKPTLRSWTASLVTIERSAQYGFWASNIQKALQGMDEAIESLNNVEETLNAALLAPDVYVPMPDDIFVDDEEQGQEEDEEIPMPQPAGRAPRRRGAQVVALRRGPRRRRG